MGPNRQVAAAATSFEGQEKARNAIKYIRDNPILLYQASLSHLSDSCFAVPSTLQLSLIMTVATNVRAYA